MRTRPLPLLVATLALAAGASVVVAQIEGSARGVAPIDSSDDFEVSGVTVDVVAGNAEAARLGGWRVAQRKAWTQLSRRLGGAGGTLSDGTLDSLVSGIVVENEQIGPRRYIARLGVLFDRERAGQVLGISTYVSRSSPMVVIPVIWSGGAGQAFEGRSEWQQAWARYRTGGSSIDYIRPLGSGSDALLLNVGQTLRPGRGWWKTVLGLYGGTDVLVPTVRLYRQWPGGPVIGAFEARGGPDNRMLARFSLRVASAAGLPKLMDAGVVRMDAAYQAALNNGALRPDPGLTWVPPAERPVEAEAIVDSTAVDPSMAVPVVRITVQFDTPGVGAVTATESALRGIPGVGSAATESLALGGLSVMAVGYAGLPDTFKAALETRGWQVFGSGTVLRIRRAPQLLPPELQADNSIAG